MEIGLDGVVRSILEKKKTVRVLDQVLRGWYMLAICRCMDV